MERVALEALSDAVAAQNEAQMKHIVKHIEKQARGFGP